MKTAIRLGLRGALAGSLLFGGTLVASVMAGSLPASVVDMADGAAIGAEAIEYRDSIS
jgi:hypothetical protein